MMFRPVIRDGVCISQGASGMTCCGTKDEAIQESECLECSCWVARGEQVDKVYCSDCRYLEEIKDAAPDTIYRCLHPDNKLEVSDDKEWLRAGASQHILDKFPGDRNKDNDCPWYEASADG